jgi:hypothetical protein
MTTTTGPQQRYDHRLRDLVRRTGDVTIATDFGVPRSTARGWLGAVPAVVVSLDVADLTVAVLAQRLGKVWASPSTWYHLVRTYGADDAPGSVCIRRSPREGCVRREPMRMWHIDTTVIRLLDGDPRLISMP